MKEYPNSDVIEKAILVWLFHDSSLRELHLPTLLPSVFLNPERRLVLYVMQKLSESKAEITIPNILLYMITPNEKLSAFIKRNSVKNITENDLNELFFDMEIRQQPDLFGVAKDLLIKYAFARFVEDRIDEIKYWNSYPGSNENSIISNCKSIIKIKDILRGQKQEIVDQLQKAMDKINSDEEYVSTSSQALNNYIGGWTRGYIASVIAKSSHGKSTWIDYNTIQSLLTNKIQTATIISPEETADTRWRRIISSIFRISTTMMRQKTAKIKQEHINKIREMFGKRLTIHDDVFRMKDIIDVIHSSKSDMIVVDHLQSIDYPGSGDFLARMIGGIPAIIDAEKRIAKQRNIPIINLSQVNDKDIQRSDRLIKAPRYWDAFASSVLFQASREFIALWYPHKDYEDNPLLFGNKPPEQNDIRISIEKSSFTSIGKIHLEYEYEFSSFKDKAKPSNKNFYTSPKEHSLDQLNFL